MSESRRIGLPRVVRKHGVDARAQTSLARDRSVRAEADLVVARIPKAETFTVAYGRSGRVPSRVIAIRDGNGEPLSTRTAHGRNPWSSFAKALRASRVLEVLVSVDEWSEPRRPNRARPGSQKRFASYYLDAIFDITTPAQ